MTADDLERRAIIAAHDAECTSQCGEDPTRFRKLRTSEKAIVDLWREDVETIERVRKIAFDPETVSGLEHGVIGTSPDTYGGIGKDEAIDIGVYALRDIRAALDGPEVTG